MIHKIANNGKPSKSFANVLKYVFNYDKYIQEFKLNKNETNYNTFNEIYRLHKVDISVGILKTEWIGGTMAFADPIGLLRQFKVCQQARPEITTPVFHSVIYLPVGETLDRNQWQEAIALYSKELGFTENHPYTIVRHYDELRKREHVHIIISRVSYDGKVNNLAHSYYKGMSACRKLEKIYGLQKTKTTKKITQTT